MVIKVWTLLQKLCFSEEQGVFYIGGSDVLPPPLKGEEEQKALESRERGEEQAKQHLVEHNLRLVVYIARRFENTGTNLEDLKFYNGMDLTEAEDIKKR